MGTRLMKLKLVYSKKELSDGKTIGGKGRLTDSLIDKLAHYYGNAIRCNSTSVKEMRKAIWAVWGHSCSTDDEPMHWFCPTNPNTWFKYNAAINNNLQKRNLAWKLTEMFVCPWLNMTIVESLRQDRGFENCLYFVRVFGTECFVHVPQQKRRKWDKKSVKGIFVGYSGERDGYRIWIKDQNKVILSRDVIFQNEKSSCVPDVSSDIQNSDMEIVKKPLQIPDPGVGKEIEDTI
ncbi:uncharacterized protein TNCV_4258831 [Trichonephila clavipes]|nr:uncharacterized protein TNCV_4258831 [Trichonephila clavipes]